MSVCPRSLLLGLLIIFSYLFCAVEDEVKAPKKCRFSFYTRPIPVAFISKYKESSDKCTRAGVIFTTKRGYRVCVDPSFKWVKRATDIIDRRIVEGPNSTQPSG